MFESFLWMFKVENFKAHFLKLFSIIFIFWVPLIVLFFILDYFSLSYLILDSLILKILFIIVFLLPFLCFAGYFWALTDNIIYRDTDIYSQNIYNGKVKTINIITLPDWNIFKFIWRGMASIVATIILYIPFALILGFFSTQIQAAAMFWGWSTDQIIILKYSLFIVLWLCIPALLWNYACRNSIVAVLNFPKAINIIFSYPGRYLKYVLSFIIVSLIEKFLFVILALVLGVAQISAMFSINSIVAEGINIAIFVFVLTSYIISLYFLFVYSYLLGTLTPVSEN